MMKSDESTNEQLYCIHTGKRCTNCHRCNQMPSYTIINNILKSNNWDKLVIALLIIAIIILVMILAPLIMDESSHLIEKPVNYFDSNPTYLSNYQPRNSYSESSINDYNYNPVTSTSNYELPKEYVTNTTGESYRSM